MSEQKQKSEAYLKLRTAFDELDVDEKALFLVEAAMSMVAHGAREAGNVVTKVVDDIVDNIKKEQAAEDGAEAEAEAEEAPAPEKKPAAKKTTKKRAPRKKPADSEDKA